MGKNSNSHTAFFLIKVELSAYVVYDFQIVRRELNLDATIRVFALLMLHIQSIEGAMAHFMLMASCISSRFDVII